MSNSSSPASLSSRIIKTQPAKWDEFQYIQQEDFKSWSPDAKAKLKNSILENQFTTPFYVWEDLQTGVIYCLDGRHRTLAMEELRAEGVNIPDLLDATFIYCIDKSDAAKLVLVYSSIYAKITQQGLFDFIKLYDLEYDSIKKVMDIPDFSIDRFDQKFDTYGLADQDEEMINEEDLEVFVQEGDVFEINGHRLACGSFKDNDLVNFLIDGQKARILNTDPPYNIPMSTITNQDFDDFAEGVGEMSDEEFVLFLVNVMQTAQLHSVPGAIHYIFMDWRHVWHMTEAGRRAYGSPQPKQMCVWNKDHMGNGSFYRPKHELCFVFNNEPAKALWNRDLLDHGGSYKDNNELVFIFKAGDEDAKHLSHLEMKDRIRTNVWNYPSANSHANPDRFALKNHPTPKPVNMIADAILDTSNEQDIVIDWFLGSGTALIACEQTKRRCYATEIKPLYVQFSIIRFIKFCQKRGIQINFKHLNGCLTLNQFSDAADKISNNG